MTRELKDGLPVHVQSETATPDGPYKVQKGEPSPVLYMWELVAEDGTPQGISFHDEDDAEEYVEALNDAWREGWNAHRASVARETGESR